MLEFELRFEDGSVQVKRLPVPLEIGRSSQCGLRLAGWRVGKRHARIEQRQDGFFLDDFGSLIGTLVNGQRVAQYGPLAVGDEIVIGPCLIYLRRMDTDPRSESSLAQVGVDLNVASSCVAASAVVVASKVAIVVEGGASYTNSSTKAALVDATEQVPAALPGSPDFVDLPALLQHRRRLHLALLEALDLRRRDIASMSDAALRSEANSVLTDIIQKDQSLPSTLDQQGLLLDVVNEAIGLGPLEPLLADSRISEIMVNRHDEIFVESAGKLTRHPSTFSSEQAVLGVIERIVSPLGRRIDESSPMVDARLRDGSRVNAIIAPIALRGASLTIRKFPQNRLLMDDLLRVGALDSSMCAFLQACVAHRKNIIVSGGTGSGKTTLLNILSNCIPEDERIVTIEDAAELRLDHQNLVALEARPPNLEGRGQVDIRDLVRNALRMRPDRIVIGECRGGEAFDMLAAMNTGHEGSLTTLHANSPRDALSRLETMILMAGMDLPLAAVREHIAASIDLLVQQARLSNGRRLITSIVEVTGIESGRIQTQQLFEYQVGPPSAFTGCGVVPEFFSKNGLQLAGLTVDLFNQYTQVQNMATSFQSDEPLDAIRQ